MRKIKVGVAGLGFIGVSHIEAIRRLGFADVAAAADTNRALARAKAEACSVPKCYDTLEELLADPEIDVVHNCTPNHLHLEVNEKIIRAGKHVFSEKPLGLNSDETGRMLALLKEHPEVKSGVNFNYRMNPLVQEMKRKVQNGEIGAPRLVHGSYLQDWLMYDTDYNWRIEPEFGGVSRAVADIGSHWMDAAQTIVGSRICSVCADIATLLPMRKKPLVQVETFSQNKGAYEERPVKTEDYGAVLFRMENGTRGVFYVSQVSAGRKCYLNVEVDGSKASLYWNQETADRMWMGFRDEDNREVMRNPGLMDPRARQYTYLAAGHPEGWNDALRNNIQSFYEAVLSEGNTEQCDFATFEDGHYIALLTEAILKSSGQKCWVNV